MGPETATIETLPADDVFRALASETRRRILSILGGPSEPDKTCCAPAEVCACKLSEALGVSAPTVSHHMATLIEAGLVSSRRDGRWVYYTLERDALRAVAGMLQSL